MEPKQTDGAAFEGMVTDMFDPEVKQGDGQEEDGETLEKDAPGEQGASEEGEEDDK